ncbi:hypothetical protein N7520_000614 [Penicillium odoratum]|uniref:uncharacterized protein n=1 Tax=Penicillium odoratum TaxID=1167516 RepID=UPI002547DC9B|nr:uncharacterized protein N7520_000614 [Penicillium odoratum]KAJ5777368.1 hypothetical protein N7520_000614 [Penicillium odoratum]
MQQTQEKEQVSPLAEIHKDEGTTSSQITWIGPLIGLHFSGLKQPPVTLVWGVPKFSSEAESWARSRAGQPMSFAMAYERESLAQHSSHQDAEIMQMRVHMLTPLELPDLQLVDSFLQVYTESGLRRRYPVIDPALFRETVDLAYKKVSGSPLAGNASRAACIYAFLAMKSLICEDEDQTYALIDVELCTLKARCLMAEALNEEASLETLQAATMLVSMSLSFIPEVSLSAIVQQALHGIIFGSLQTASLFNTVAVRLLFMLGGHTLAPAANLPWCFESSAIISQQLRNLFWLCYVIDKDVSFRAGQPPCINDADCDLTLPPHYFESLYSAYIPEDLLGHFTPTFPFDVRLSIVKSRIYTALYALSTVQKSRLDVEQTIRSIEHTLAEFPSTAGSNAIRSPLEISVEASRLMLLQYGIQSCPELPEISWIVTFHILLAAMVIFWNILQNPSAGHAWQDLQLLRGASRKLENLYPALRLPFERIYHTYFISQYAREFHRLAKHAILGTHDPDVSLEEPVDNE